MGSRAEAAACFNAEGEEDVILGRGRGKPLGIFGSSAGVICRPWGMGTFGADVGQGWIISPGVNDDGVAIWGVREKDNIRAQVGVDHAGTRFIAGRDVRSFANALEHATYRVVPKAGSKSLGFGVTADLVVTKGVDFGGRKRLPVKLEGGVGGDIAIRTFVLLTRGWSYLKEESASCNHCKVGV